MTWEPIETAPKDGTAIVSYTAAGLLRIIHWQDDRGSFGPGWCYGYGNSPMIDKPVTHWFPLPEGPRR